MKFPKLPTTANVWNGKEMTHPPAPPKRDAVHPSWVWINCGCCSYSPFPHSALGSRASGKDAWGSALPDNTEGR